MDIDTFRSTQGPLRERYKHNVKAAFLTLQARGAVGDGTVTCRVDTARGLATAGIHPRAGGSGRELCAGDMLLEALVACAGVSLTAAAATLGVSVNSAAVVAEGDVDLRGALGVEDTVPVGFQEIRLHFKIDTDAPEGQLEQLQQLVERYCVVFQTLQNSPKTSVRLDVASSLSRT